MKNPRKQSKVCEDRKLRSKNKAAQLLIIDVLFLLGLIDDQGWLLIPYTHFWSQSPDIRNYWWVGMHTKDQSMAA